MTEESIAAEVLRCAPESRPLFLAAGGVLALWLHTALLVALALSSVRRPAAEPLRAIRVEATEYAVDLPPAPTVKRGVIRSAPVTRVDAPDAASAAKPAPTPPAAQPKVVHTPPPSPSAPRAEVEAPPPEMADFTSPGAPTYVGGTHSAPGTASAATPAVGVAQGDPRGGGSTARTVGLAANDWHCPWPAEAESLDVDTEVVVLRAVVNGQGQPLHVTILVDPGHGFGTAALACAQTAIFEPARDGHGVPYAATSPPIRVTFTREHL